MAMTDILLLQDNRDYFRIQRAFLKMQNVLFQPRCMNVTAKWHLETDGSKAD